MSYYRTKAKKCKAEGGGEGGENLDGGGRCSDQDDAGPYPGNAGNGADAGAGRDGETWKALGLALLVLPVLWKGLPLLCGRLARLGAAKVWLLLTLLCLAVKGAWILLMRVPPSGDYATFWGYAKALAGQPVLEGGRYMALFPHIFGYSSFLSWFIRLLGPGALLAQGLNVLLTAASGSLLFLLGRRWWGLPAGISAYLLWIVCPSQTIYNSLVLSEPLYTALLLGAFFLLAAGEGRRPILRGVAAGLALRWFNGVRPIAAVVIIALLPLMGDKLRAFLGSDHACVGYVGSVVRHTRLFSLACNGFYYAALVLAGAGLVRLWRNRARSAAPVCAGADLRPDAGGGGQAVPLFSDPCAFAAGTGGHLPACPGRDKKFSKKPGKPLTGNRF